MTPDQSLREKVEYWLDLALQTGANHQDFNMSEALDALLPTPTERPDLSELSPLAETIWRQNVQQHMARAEKAERDRDALQARLDEAEGRALKLDAAMSWTDYPFIDNNTPRDELLQRVGFMQKDAEPIRAQLASKETNNG